MVNTQCVVKYVQSNQYLLGHYELEVKASEERHGTRYIKGYRIVSLLGLVCNNEDAIAYTTLLTA